MNVNEADVEVKIETAARRWLANLKGAASVRVGTVPSRYQVTNNELEAMNLRQPCSRRGGVGGWGGDYMAFLIPITAELKVCQQLTFWEIFNSD